MTDIEWMFKEDVREKKSLVASSRHRKCGSKSKKCSMPSDYLTARQKKKLNGEVKVYKMNVPMTWDDFKAMPIPQQSEYLNTIINKYHANGAALSMMFNVSAGAIRLHCARHSLGIKLPGRESYRMTYDQRDAWNKFLGKDEASFKSVVGVTEVTTESEVNAESEVSTASDVATESNAVKEESPTTSAFTFGMSKLSVDYDGAINLNEVMKYIESAVGNNFHGHLHISFEKC